MIAHKQASWAILMINTNKVLPFSSSYLLLTNGICRIKASLRDCIRQKNVLRNFHPVSTGPNLAPGLELLEEISTLNVADESSASSQNDSASQPPKQMQ